MSTKKSKRQRLADVPIPSADQPFLTRLEACKLARVGTSTFDKAVEDKRITVRWNGTRMIVPRAEVVRFVEGLPTEPPA
jgi:hypothetical protein